METKEDKKQRKKRFKAACAAMNGICTIIHTNSNLTPELAKQIVKESYMLADELLAQETKMKDDLIEALEEYIIFIGKELDELAILASIHGWKSRRIKEGEERKKYIKILKSKINGNT